MRIEYTVNFNCQKNQGHSKGFTLSRLLERIGIRHGREITALAAPTILTMLSHTLMWTVDSAFLGHVSSMALGAAGLGGLLTWTGYCMFNGLSRITSTFVSQSNGRGDDRAVAEYTWQGIWVAIVAGLVLMWAGMESHWLLSLTGHSRDIQENAYTYIRLRTLSAVATQLTMTLSGFFQGRKDVAPPMYAGIVSNAVNILLDWILIFGWSGLEIGGTSWLAVDPMGIRGAAIATSIAVFLNAGILFVWMVAPAANRLRYRIHVPRLPAWGRIRKIIQVGVPLSLGELVDMLSFSIFTALIGRRGIEALAASQITIQMISFSFMPIWGITTAASVLVGNEIGRGDRDRAARYGRETYLLTFYFSIGIGILMVLFGHEIFSIFTDDPAVLVFAPLLALTAAGFQVFDGLRMIGIGILQGAGDTRYPTILAFAVLFGVFVPLTWYVVEVRGGGVTEAWAAGIVSYVLMAAGVFHRFRGGAWRRIDLEGV